MFAAVRLATLAEDEVARRLTLLYAQPVTRLRHLAVETAAALGGVLALSSIAGVATWLGAAIVDADLTLAEALLGAWNILPIALLCVGAAALALGWAPRAVVAIGALPAVGGFVLRVIAGTAGAPPWVGELSPFAHLAAVPHASPNWPAAAAMTMIAVVLAAVGVEGYRRRDLRV